MSKYLACSCCSAADDDVVEDGDLLDDCPVGTEIVAVAFEEDADFMTAAGGFRVLVVEGRLSAWAGSGCRGEEGALIMSLTKAAQPPLPNVN